MKPNDEDGTSTREAVLKLVSADDRARLRGSDGPGNLADGDEYIDLQALDRGVRRAFGSTVVAAHVLPRKSVHEATWSKIVATMTAD